MQDSTGSNKNQISTSTTPTGSTEYSKASSANLLNKIFTSLKAIFPGWTSAIRDQETFNQVRAEWLKGLLENGINSEAQIEYGLANARRHASPFLPSVGQFIQWCAIEAESVHPTIEACYAELVAYIAASATKRNPLSPILYHTIHKSMDFYNYKKIEREYERYKMFEIAFKATQFHLERGGELFSPVVAARTLESPENASYELSESDKIKGEQVLGSLRGIFDEQPEPEINEQAALGRKALELAKQRLTKGE